MPDISTRTLRKLLRRETFEFSCNRCNRCCRCSGTVYFSREDLENITTFLRLGRSEKTFLKKRLFRDFQNGYYAYNSSKACYFLDEDQGCRIYPVRPLQCRTYPFWPSNFETGADYRALKKECEGVGHSRGESYSLLQTLRLLNRTRKKFLEPQTDQENPLLL